MYCEFYVEDSSGGAMLDIFVPKIAPQLVDPQNNPLYKIHFYKGVGSIPKGLNPKTDPKKRILLDQLPRLLRGFANTHKKNTIPAYMFVICDSDRKCLVSFKAELEELLNACNPKPNAAFCIAVEEMEAWLLGDIAAIQKAYPNADKNILNRYNQDSICGTWELFWKATRDDLPPMGNYKEVGTQKHEWAKNIAPHMNVEKNQSPSFQYFRDSLRNAVNDSHAAP